MSQSRLRAVVFVSLLGCSSHPSAMPDGSLIDGSALTDRTATDSARAQNDARTSVDATNTDSQTRVDVVRPTGDGSYRAPFDWVGVIGTGQSLSIGCASHAISTTQPFHNLKLLDSGPDPKYPTNGAATAVWSAVPLVEPIRMDVPGNPQSGDYPTNICRGDDGLYGETPHSGMANTMSDLWSSRGLGEYVTAHSIVGSGGYGIQYIATGNDYAAALSETRVYRSLAQAAGKSYGVAGILFTHGETDATNQDYESAVFAFWQHLNGDLRGITGQSSDVVMFASQQSSFEGGYNSSAVQLWRAGVDHPGQIVCIGPKYAYGSYYVHLPGGSYERLGEKYAEVFDQVVNQGIGWRPLEPVHVARNGTAITVDFDVPNPPLVWEEHVSAPHQTSNLPWANGRGFEVVDGDMNQIAIQSVAIQGASVVITLAQLPASGAALTVGYAVTAPDNSTPMRGQLRDSDPFIGYSVETLDVQVTQGSATISAPTGSNRFDRRAPMDLVTGAGVSANTVLASSDRDQAVLSSPWTGSTGMASMTFRHDQYNYCVHFALPIP